MSYGEIEFESPIKVEIARGRWTLNLTITTEDGVEHKFVASADSGITYGDGIYFGPLDEYTEIASANF